MKKNRLIFLLSLCLLLILSACSKATSNINKILINNGDKTVIVLKDAEAQLTVNSDKSKIWRIEDSNIATIDSTGKITAHKIGMTTISVAVDGYIDTITLNVVYQPENAPTAPLTADVKIGLYTEIIGTKMINMNLPGWRNWVEEPELNFSGNEVKALSTDWILYDLSEGMDASSNTTLYLQVWTAGHNALKIKLVDFESDGYQGANGDTEFEYTTDISQNAEWVQIAIPLSTWKNTMENFTDINQIILTPIGSGTMYIDNIYIK